MRGRGGGSGPSAGMPASGDGEMTGLIGWAVAFGLLLAYQGLCLVRAGDGWPAFSEVLRVVMRHTVGRWALFGVWLWGGWHLFMRGWQFFLRA